MSALVRTPARRAVSTAARGNSPLLLNVAFLACVSPAFSSSA